MHGVVSKPVRRTVEVAVECRTASLVLPTYEPLPPDRHPMFLEKRVYQGSCGKVYPLPFYDRISTEPTPRTWNAIHLENGLLRATILPEIGGRIHSLTDLTNGYELIYNQAVLKPALVGLAGPWASGGIEFNWPQRHRPATYMPVSSHIERHEDGSVTVWMSDHDPMARMKGMHGVSLHPGRAVLELKVRLYNRTPYTQTFLWWANVATKVHELYQSFFPPDVTHVADHAKRATSLYPFCEDHYYGVPYGERARHGTPPHELPSRFRPRADLYKPNDLSWYANIPVPTSYMCIGTKQDFFGGYDHRESAGLVHVANHHISPGKKQWTWGNHEFGYAWDRLLTDPDADGVCQPYIELMAGVYTDNQPDFSYLAPGETKAFSQFWYPIREIGPAHHANVDAAVSLNPAGRRAVRIGVCTTRVVENAEVSLTHAGKPIWRRKATLSPTQAIVETVELQGPFRMHDLKLTISDSSARVVIAHQPAPPPVEKPRPGAPATEPPAPQKIASSDELFLVGQHLSQYRHATRMPELYWREALRRDPLDLRCNTAMGHWHLRRGEFESAEQHFRRAVARQTSRNPNPADGEAYYGLGLALRFLNRLDEAYDAFYKSTWNQAQYAPAFHAIAEIDAVRRDWASAIQHIRQSLRCNPDNLRARNLLAIALRHVGDTEQSQRVLADTRMLDPLDFWSRHIAGEPLDCDTQTLIDIAIDYGRIGECARALEVLADANPDLIEGAAPLVPLYQAYFSRQLGDLSAARRFSSRATRVDRSYCFPHRLEDQVVLEQAIAHDSNAGVLRYLLGCYLYDRKRHVEAIASWEHAVRLDPQDATAWRNLGIGYFNIRRKPRRAKAAYDRAVAAQPGDARLRYEHDQLLKRLGQSPRKRLALLEKHRDLIAMRDDLSVEYCALLNQTSQSDAALKILTTRIFQPWEGGEGMALGQYVRAHLNFGRTAMQAGSFPSAVTHFRAALNAPANLGEVRHLLANQSDVHYELGLALRETGDTRGADEHLAISADFKGDFQDMSVRQFSEMTFYSAQAARKLGRRAQAGHLLKGLLKFARQLGGSTAAIDYFATSLPTLLLFDDDLQAKQVRQARFLEAQALLGLGRNADAVRLLRQVLRDDPNHQLAFDALQHAQA